MTFIKDHFTIKCIRTFSRMFLSNSTKTVENSFYLTLACEELPYLLILKILSFLTKKVHKKLNFSFGQLEN
jgi:hypothetical protein